MDIFIKKSINIILIIVFTFSFSNAQNSLERQLREIDELRAKLDGLKIDELPTKKYSNKEDEIWGTILSTWESDLAGEDWISTFCFEDVLSWTKEDPMPHDKISLQRKRAYDSKNSKLLFYDIKKTGIVVKNDLAIVYYYYITETLDAGGKVKKEKGKLTDILVKENNKWKYLGWSETK